MESNLRRSQYAPRRLRVTGPAALLLLALLAACSRPTPEMQTPVPATQAVPQAAATDTGAPAAPLPEASGAPAGGTPAAEAPGSATGLETPENSVVGVELENVTNQGEMVQQAGVKWIRRNALLWSQVEPEKGQRNWDAVAPFLAELEAAANLGLETIVIIRSTPPWAQSVPGVYCSIPSAAEYQAFGAFLADTVALLGAPPYNVRYFEIANEPDIAPELVPADIMFGCWGQLEDPYYGGGTYGELLKVVSPLMKAANPEARVTVGGLLLDCDPNNPPPLNDGSGGLKDCTPARFLEGILESGAGEAFDAVSFHAYDYYFGPWSYGNLNWNSVSSEDGPVVKAKTGYLRDLLAGYGFSDKELINTEGALICTLTDGSCTSPEFEQTKAAYLAMSNAAAAAVGLEGNIWYSMLGWRESGLVNQDMTPRPSFQALTINAEKLAEATYSGPVEQFEGVMGYEFSRQGSRMWVLWALGTEPLRVTLTEPPDAVSDVYGEALTLGVELDSGPTLEVGPSPVYVEWNP